MSNLNLIYFIIIKILYLPAFSKLQVRDFYTGRSGSFKDGKNIPRIPKNITKILKKYKVFQLPLLKKLSWLNFDLFSKNL